MEPYDGTASNWFGWIDLFKALIHDTAMSPGEKLAVLHSSLTGDCRDLVYPLGGGEEAYKEALRCPKASCGRRDVIRAAHLQALDKLDPGKSPSQLKRFTERPASVSHVATLCEKRKLPVVLSTILKLSSFFKLSTLVFILSSGSPRSARSDVYSNGVANITRVRKNLWRFFSAQGLFLWRMRRSVSASNRTVDSNK
uniref:Uncharacterized protein n=1 Tax=Trichuris muris TaxID=70415 RepID=A0A5S6R0D0_TRIMR